MILEYACLRLEGKDLPDRKVFLHDAPYNKRTSNLRYALTQGLRVLSRASKHTFHLLQDTTDASLVYYIGKWTNVAAYIQFKASKDRIELLEILQLCKAYLQWQDFFEVDTSCYACFMSTLQRPLRPRQSLYGAAIVSIVRLEVQHGKVPAGEELERTIRTYLPQDMLLSGNPIIRVDRGASLPTNTQEADPGLRSSRLLISGWKDQSSSGQSIQERANLALDNLDRIISTCNIFDVIWASPIRLC